MDHFICILLASVLLSIISLSEAQTEKLSPLSKEEPEPILSVPIDSCNSKSLSLVKNFTVDGTVLLKNSNNAPLNLTGVSVRDENENEFPLLGSFPSNYIKSFTIPELVKYVSDSVSTASRQVVDNSERGFF